MDYYPRNSLFDAPHAERGQLSVGGMFTLMRDHIWEIVTTAVAVLTLAVAYLLIASPIYSADVLMRVDPPEPNALGLALQGQEALPPPAPSASTEMAVMSSRAVLDPVIEKFRFDVSVTPRTVPVLGSIAEKFATPGEPSGAWFGLSSFAWGGERVQVGSLDVPRDLEEKKLTLTALENGAYELRGPSGQVLVKGFVGKPAQGNGVSMLIKELSARPDTEFQVIRWNPLDAIAQFEKHIKIGDKEKESGLMQLAYEDKNPDRATDVANAMADQYLAYAIAARQQNDTTTLAFINGELPRLLKDLRKAEDDLKHFRSGSQSIQPTSEAQAYLQGGLDIDKQIATLQIQRTQLLERYTPDSRWVQTADRQLQQLQDAKAQFDGHFNDMPSSERQSVDLVRAQKVAETVYLGMVQKAEQLQVRRASTTGGVHIVDPAIRPHRPVKPKPEIVLAGGMVLGLLSGVMLVFMRRHVMTGVTDPRYVESRMSVPVFGEILFSQQQLSLDRHGAGGGRKALRDAGGRAGLPLQQGAVEPQFLRDPADADLDAALTANHTRILAARYPHDPSVEALRAVRTAVARDLAHARNPHLMVIGPTPSAGKSFVAANLAILHAEIGSRVVLIDADMRRGHLAALFGEPNRGGLSEVLSGRMTLRNALRPTSVDGLTFLSCGIRPENPAALLMKPQFKELLDRLATQFDMVIIDTPPFLAVTDASIIACQTGSSLLVLRSGMQSEQEIADTVKKLERAEGRIAGAVFNGIPLRRSTRNYGYAANYASDYGDLETTH
ncbi:polysaccharide biosynthesis tyrosine autokinase [Paraburkholderia sp. D15]|uniref:polysaccharide biosynthesis tyrosine autokinase n=1 Tax=Paraburkholderia sp. D15 TaxID=2880218 RepID=UPI002479F56A|nr:polysaccharide biosynthesis tyrosine autokinase [Paraburkholderia sp. D15]WGS52897.1 polysaccharide biosynthesis tyrosine autokinase [Paraburkholderia sp. D15]WKF61681.1 Tyrosine-protein kinase wzc [Paraburkholderia busanensis]